MEYGRLKNGYLEKPGTTLILPDGRSINNPREEALEELGFTFDQVLRANGYKQVIETEQPEPESGFYFEASWEEQEDKIVRVWTKIEAPVEPEPQPTESDEIDKILMGVYD